MLYVVDVVEQGRRRQQRERQKQKNWFIKESHKFARPSRFSCTFFFRHCTTTTWKCLISRFMEDVNKRRRIFLSLSRLECCPQEINSREFLPHVTSSVNWNKREKVWENASSFQKWRFRCRRRRRSNRRSIFIGKVQTQKRDLLSIYLFFLLRHQKSF